MKRLFPDSRSHEKKETCGVENQYINCNLNDIGLLK